MKFTTWLQIFVLPGIISLIFCAPSYSQTCGSQPLDYFTINLQDDTVVDVESNFDDAGNEYAEFIFDDYIITVSWWIDTFDTGVDIRITSTSGEVAGPRPINLGVDSRIVERLGSPADTETWPHEYSDLWNDMVGTSGLMLDSDQFWAVFKDANEDKLEYIRTLLTDIHAGILIPDTFKWVYRGTFIIEAEGDDHRLWWGVSFRENSVLWITTPDPAGTVDPSLHMTLQIPDDEILFRLLYMTGDDVITFSARRLSERTDLTDPQLPYNCLEALTGLLPLYMDQIAEMRSIGIFEEEIDMDYEWLIESAINCVQTHASAYEETEN